MVAAPLFNGIGNLGGFIGPFMVGALVQETHSFAIPCLVMAGCLFLAGLMVAAMPRLVALPASVLIGLWDPKPQAIHGQRGSGWVELRVRE